MPRLVQIASGKLKLTATAVGSIKQGLVSVMLHHGKQKKKVNKYSNGKHLTGKCYCMVFSVTEGGGREVTYSGQ